MKNCDKYLNFSYFVDFWTARDERILIFRFIFSRNVSHTNVYPVDPPPTHTNNDQRTPRGPWITHWEPLVYVIIVHFTRTLFGGRPVATRTWNRIIMREQRNLRRQMRAFRWLSPLSDRKCARGGVANGWSCGGERPVLGCCAVPVSRRTEQLYLSVGNFL